MLILVLAILSLAALIYQSKRFSRLLVSNGVKRALIVIAHPDDEAMFFVPLIRRLVEMKVEVRLLCLTNGNSETREAELAESCRVLGIGGHTVTTFLKDGMKEAWDLESAWKRVGRLIEEANPDAVFTFDKDGVSGHINHSSTNQLIVSNRESLGNKLVFTLTTYQIWRKYVLPVHLLFLLTETVFGLSVFSFVPWLNWKAMSSHKSQYVWFRRLFVAFSSYTYHNSFRMEGKSAK